jgi:hypothetical protein
VRLYVVCHVLLDELEGEKDGETGDVGTQLGFGGPNPIMDYGCPLMSLEIILNTN